MNIPAIADHLVDRRRLKRRLMFWRVVAIVALTLAVVAAIGRVGLFPGRTHIVRLSVDGIVVEDPERDWALETVAEDTSVKALIVRIDSPGGTVVGGESLYNSLRRVAARKPVVAVMGEMATSAAYMTALGGDHILAREGTITGSIGVILQTATVTELLDKIGVKPETIKSSPLKAQPNPLEPLTPEAREATRYVVTDIYDMFVGLVEQRRRLPHDRVMTLADGRVFTGRQAVANGLVDALGSETEAREWLLQSHGIGLAVPVKDAEIGGTEQRLRDLIGGAAEKILFPEWLRLDGLVSVWHPEL